MEELWLSDFWSAICDGFVIRLSSIERSKLIFDLGVMFVFSFNVDFNMQKPLSITQIEINKIIETTVVICLLVFYNFVFI